MAPGRYLRHGKHMPSRYVAATIVTFVALCLIGLWVLSSPAEQQLVSEVERAPIDSTSTSGKKSTSETQVFEESTGNEQQDNGDKQDESFQQNGKLGGKETQKSINEDEEDNDATKIEEKGMYTEKDPLQQEEQDSFDSPGTTTKSDKSASDTSASEGEAELEESGGAESEIQIENSEKQSNWTTQASESKEEREEVERENKQQTDVLETDADKKIDDDGKIEEKGKGGVGESVKKKTDFSMAWKLCNFEGVADYVPCLDNKKAIKALKSTKHFEHRERHCPNPAPTCLVPLPQGYRMPIRWPQSRNEIYYSNVPHPGLVSYKKDQNWVKRLGDRLLFPGGGTQFVHGALHYIDYIEQVVPDVAWGKRTRVVLDVGCGVASFGGYLFDKNVLTMSFAPKDEHEAQIQLALERGIPALLSVMGTQRLTFPSNVYDMVHCARCRVPWHVEGGKLLLELNRVLRPGGYFVWSATPVYRKNQEDKNIWKETVAITTTMCWELVSKTLDSSTNIGVAIFCKPTTNGCYETRKANSPPLCNDDDKSDAAWYIPMTACIHKIPSENNARGSKWPEDWPMRLTGAPAWLNNAKGLYGKLASDDFRSDTEHWQRVLQHSYLYGLGINWENVRNVMDMKAVYGGFAAALASQPVWVMNVVQYDEADTLPVIFDRGLFGIYHDWCESFSSYPRTYDLLHSDHLFKKLQARCNIVGTIVEMDRLLRPGGWAIFREKVHVVEQIQPILESLHWQVHMTYIQGDEELLVAQKTEWRPEASS